MAFENGTVFRVAVKATHKADGDQQVNTMHYDVVAGPAGEMNGQAFADTIRDGVRSALVPLYTSAWSIDPVIVMEELDPQNPNAARQEWASGSVVDGTRITAAELLPRATCVVVTLRTDHIGRRHTGRFFVGSSFDESDQADGVWDTTSGHWTSLLGYIQSWPQSVTHGTGDFQSVAVWSIYSRTQRAELLDDYLSPVRSSQIRTRVHWLRSREP
jgi:hypothetical protein